MYIYIEFTGNVLTKAQLNKTHKYEKTKTLWICDSRGFDLVERANRFVVYILNFQTLTTTHFNT